MISKSQNRSYLQGAEKIPIDHFLAIEWFSQKVLFICFIFFRCWVCLFVLFFPVHLQDLLKANVTRFTVMTSFWDGRKPKDSLNVALRLSQKDVITWSSQQISRNILMKIHEIFQSRIFPIFFLNKICSFIFILSLL